MAEAERGLWGAESIACAGVALQAAADRRPFALPGDRAVWGRDRPLAIEHQRLEFDFDLRARRLNGVATTTFRPRNDGLREAVFDAIELDVEAVTDGNGRALPFTVADGSLRIDLGRARSSRRSITTVVRYSCRPRRGLYFNRPDDGYPQRPAQIWTQGQAEDSAYYFPCFDYPGEKATCEIVATVPAGWYALSNGRLAEVREDRRRRRTTYHWTQEQPLPAYLVTLVAGQFEVVEEEADGVPVLYHGPPGSGDDLRRAFGRTPEMVRFFSERIGVPYPWAKYATVAVADFIFGGMENTSATTMTDTLLHDERAHVDFEEVADSITAHELAHQWFGDLLTCREWSHGWLNESFATYFDALFTEHQRGWDAFRHDLYQKAKVYFQEDSGRYRRPLVENVYAEPIDIFDRHLYERGAQVLDMIRYNLGDELWWKAIRHYARTHAGGDVLTHDFQRAIEEATGRNLDWFFEQWVWRGGHPEFKASYSWDAEHRAATVRLTQTQQPDEQADLRLPHPARDRVHDRTRAARVPRGGHRRRALLRLPARRPAALRLHRPREPRAEDARLRARRGDAAGAAGRRRPGDGPHRRREAAGEARLDRRRRGARGGAAASPGARFRAGRGRRRAGRDEVGGGARRPHRRRGGTLDARAAGGRRRPRQLPRCAGRACAAGLARGAAATSPTTCSRPPPRRSARRSSRAPSPRCGGCSAAPRTTT